MAKHKYCISSHVQLPMASAWRIITYVINILIFTVTGIVLAKSLIDTATSITARDFGFSILLYFIIHIGRALMIIVLYPIIHWSGVHLSWKECIVLMWSSLRGSMALIIVLIVYLDSRIDAVTRDRLLFHVSIIVLLTLIINGTSSKFLVKFMGLHLGTCFVYIEFPSMRTGRIELKILYNRCLYRYKGKSDRPVISSRTYETSDVVSNI